jgi:hypothetical protein
MSDALKRHFASAPGTRRAMMVRVNRTLSAFGARFFIACAYELDTAPRAGHVKSCSVAVTARMATASTSSCALRGGLRQATYQQTPLDRPQGLIALLDGDAGSMGVTVVDPHQSGK